MRKPRPRPMRRAWLFALGFGVLSACSEASELPGIETRVVVDRTEAHVGTPIGVTVEIDAPEGFTVETPSAPPPDELFQTDSVEHLEPVRLASGERHRLLWTLRARDVGNQQLPELAVPFARPDGHIEPLTVGGIPIRVASALVELPERETFFDIRPPPALAARALWIWITAGGAALLAAGALWFWLGGGTPSDPIPDLDALRARARTGVDDAVGRGEARLIAGSLRSVIAGFAAERWTLDTACLTSDELPAPVDRQLVDLLGRLDRVRFARLPDHDTVLELGEQTRGFFSGVGRR